MPVTQKDIAQKLGISQPIVAQALGDHAGVADATRQRVREAAREMGYGTHSNAAARALAGKRHGRRLQTGTLAVLTGDFFEGLPLQDVPFFQPLLRGIEREASERELDISFCMSPGRLPRLVTQQGVDGVISLYSREANALLRDHKVALPVLRLGDAASGEWALMPDNFEGVRLATRHLIQLGHRRIAYLGDLEKEVPHAAYNARLDGYLQALKDGALAVNNELIEANIGAPTQEAGAAGMERLLRRTRQVSAVVCLNDLAAMGAIERATQLGLRVPHDLSVVGFDDTAEAYNFTPHLTTVHFDRLQMGRRAIQMLCETDLENSRKLGHQLLPVELKVRASTAAPSSNFIE